jgi:hypothetical protein
MQLWVEARQGDGRSTLVWEGGTGGMVQSRLIGELARIWPCDLDISHRGISFKSLRIFDKFYFLFDTLTFLNELRHVHGLCARKEDVGGIG